MFIKLHPQKHADTNKYPFDGRYYRPKIAAEITLMGYFTDTPVFALHSLEAATTTMERLACQKSSPGRFGMQVDYDLRQVQKNTQSGA